jgi:hypothetical protein
MVARTASGTLSVMVKVVSGTRKRRLASGTTTSGAPRAGAPRGSERGIRRDGREIGRVEKAHQRAVRTCCPRARRARSGSRAHGGRRARCAQDARASRPR